jgi:hypothetical protein
MISASALPLAFSVAGAAVVFRKPGDSVEVELSARAAERVARHGAVRFEAVSEPAPERAEESPAAMPAEPVPFAPANLTPVTTEASPPAEPGAETE